jgi:Beta-propeller repeat
VRFFSTSLFFAGLIHAAIAPNAPRWSFSFTSSNLDPTSVAVDAGGNTYLAGSSVGNPFTATPGAYQTQNNGGTCYGGGGIGPPIAIPCRNVFVIKLDPSGNTIFATYLGGTANVDAAAIGVDPEGNVYVGGPVEVSLPASAFPITPGAAFPATSNQSMAGNVAYLAKLNASGTQLEYSTLIPGAFLASLTVDSAGEVFFTGQWSPSFGAFPATPGAYQTAPANSTAATVIGKLNASGSALLWGTYLGGTLGYSSGGGIGLDTSGNVLTGGTTAASDFPATAGQFSTSDGDAVGGYINIYLAKLSPGGSSLIYATLLGPGQGGLVLGPSGDIYLACWSTAFPVTGAGFGLASGRGNYLVHVGADGSSILNSTYLPFALSGLDVDAAGNAYLVGSGSAQTTAGAFQTAPPNNGPNNIVVAKIMADAQVAGVTYFGSGGATAIAAERDGSVVVAGGGQGGFFAANLFPAITLANAASYVANTAVPGEIVTIRGYGIGPAARVNSSPVNNLSGVQAYFDDFAAPIIYAQADQVNV